jgi:type I restriction enzyme, S subunit
MTNNAHWEPTTLGELLEEETLRAGDISEEEQAGLEVLSLTKDRGLIPQSSRFSERVATEDVSKYKVVRPGWIVYNPYVIWEGAIHASSHSSAGLVSPVYLVWRRRHEDGGFLDFALRTPEVISTYESLCAGAVNRRRSIKKDDFIAVEIDCPTLPERQRIGRLLKAVDRTRSIHARVVRASEALRDSLVETLLTAGLRGEPKSDSKLGRLPASWTVAPLSEYLTESKYGLGDKGEAFGAYPMLRMTNQKHGRIVPDDLQYIDLPRQRFERFKVLPRDVLFNRTNSHELVGRTAIFDLPGDYVFASYLIRLRTDASRLRPEFLNYYLGAQRTQMRLKTIARRAIGQSNISASRLAAMDIAVPEPAEQDEIVAQVDKATAKIEVGRKQLVVLDELRLALTGEVLSGRITTTDLDTARLEAATTIAGA